MEKPGQEMSQMAEPQPTEVAVTLRSLSKGCPNTEGTAELCSCCSSCKFRKQSLGCKASVTYARELLSFSSFDVVPYKKEFGGSLVYLVVA